MAMKKENQHVIVTGGSSGIGKAIALQLAQAGANISIIARGSERLRAAQSEIEQIRASATQKVVALAADVSDHAQAEQAIHSAIEQLGPPQILVTSAGIAYPDYFQDIPIEIFEQTMAVNYFGTLYCIRAALPAMQAQGTGDICLISSGAAFIGLYGYSAYGPSKFAVRGLAESLRGELKPIGIRVSIAYPPDTDTPQLIEESKTKPPATKEITATAKVWSAAEMAGAILQGMEKGKFAIAPGIEMSVLAKLHSILFPVLNQYFDRIVARHSRSV